MLYKTIIVLMLLAVSGFTRVHKARDTVHTESIKFTKTGGGTLFRHNIVVISPDSILDTSSIYMDYPGTNTYFPNWIILDSTGDPANYVDGVVKIGSYGSLLLGTGSGQLDTGAAIYLGGENSDRNGNVILQPSRIGGISGLGGNFSLYRSDISLHNDSSSGGLDSYSFGPDTGLRVRANAPTPGVGNLWLQNGIGLGLQIDSDTIFTTLPIDGRITAYGKITPIPSFDSLVSFCTIYSSEWKDILITGTWDITSDYTVPVNINGADVASDAWITTSSDDSIHFTTFSYKGKNHFVDTVDTIVSFGPGIAISPYWFGAVDDWNGTTGTDNTKYLNMTFESAYRSGPNSKVLLGSGYYKVSGILRVACVVEGVDRGYVHPSDFYGSVQYNHEPYNLQITEGTTLIWDNETLSDTDTYVIPRPVHPDYLRGKFKNMKFMSMTTDTAGGYGTGGGILFRYGAQSNAQTGRDRGFADPSAFEDLWIANFAIGIYMDQTFYTNIDNVGFRGCRTCVTIGGYGGSTVSYFDKCTFEGCGDSLHPFIDLRTTYGVLFNRINSQGTSWISVGHCNGITAFNNWYFEGQKNNFDSAMIKVADTVEYSTDKRVILNISNVTAPTGSCGDIDIRDMASASVDLYNVNMSATRIYGDENVLISRFGSSVATGAISGIQRQNDHTGPFKSASFGDNISPGAIFGTLDRQGIVFSREYLHDGTLIRLNNEARSADSFSFTMPSPAAPDLDSLYVLYAAVKGSALELNDVFIHTTGDDCDDGALQTLKITALAAGDRFRIIQDSPQLQLRYGDGNDLRMIIAFGSGYSSLYGAYIDGRGYNYPQSSYNPYTFDGEGPDLVLGAAAGGRIRYRTSSAAHLFDGGPIMMGANTSIRWNQQVPTSVSVLSGDTVGQLSRLVEDTVLYTIEEVSGTPGINVVFTISGITSFSKVTVIGRYSGSATSNHEISLSLLHDDGYYQNFETVGYDKTFDTTETYRSFKNYTFFVGNCDDYIDAGVANLRCYHAASGQTAHRFYLQQLTFDQ